MNTKHRLGIVFLFACLVLLLVVASFNQPVISASAHQIQAQATPIPIQDDTSVIGSTDGILIMGFVIMFIVIVPVIVYKKKK